MSPGIAMNDCGRVQRTVRPSLVSFAWNRTTFRSSRSPDVERRSRRRRACPARARRGCSRSPCAAGPPGRRSRATRTPAPARGRRPSGVGDDAARQQVGAAAAEEEHALVLRARVLEERLEHRLVGPGRVEARARCARRCRPAAARSTCVSDPASRDSTITRSRSPICRGELLEVRNDARVLDVRARPAPRRATYCGRATAGTRRPAIGRAQPPAAQAARDRAERGERDEEQRARQDDRQEPPRHPEVLRHDADLVEEDQRECREHDEERRVAPER